MKFCITQDKIYGQSTPWLIRLNSSAVWWISNNLNKRKPNIVITLNKYLASSIKFHISQLLRKYFLPQAWYELSHDRLKDSFLTLWNCIFCGECVSLQSTGSLVCKKCQFKPLLGTVILRGKIYLTKFLQETWLHIGKRSHICMLDPVPLEYHLYALDDNMQQGNGWETKLVIHLERNSWTPPSLMTH